MTRALVADDVLGRIATKQWELERRVREGTLDAQTVLTSLQKLIENEVEAFSIERSAWKVSSKGYDITVSEAEDYPTEVRRRGLSWDSGSTQHTFTLKGLPKKKKSSARIRLAQVERETSLGVIRLFGENDGFDFATSWDLLAFIEQAPINRIIHSNTFFDAIGDFGELFFPDNQKRYSTCIGVRAGHGRWIFDHSHFGETPAKMDCDCRIQPHMFILLKERNRVDAK